MNRRRILPAAIALLAALPAPAGAACPERMAVAAGATLSGIARACGVDVEALRMANPGLRPDTLRAGTTLVVPPQALPSRPLPIGRQGVAIAPPMVPPAIVGTRSTVILPPEPPAVPQQHILRGFGDQPGQLPLGPGHVQPFPPPFPMR